jgi:transposase
MLKKIYKLKGWTATSAIVRQNSVEVKLTIDHRYNFCCSKCQTVLKTHSVREICVRDLPIADKDVTLYVDAMQGYCVCCKRYLTLRPEICHPTCGYTWRLMRMLSRFLVHTSARFLEDEYSISYTTILRIDKEVLENDIPKPKLKNVQGVLIDEKFLGSSQGFVTVCLNAATGEPLEMVRGKNSHCLDSFFNKFNDEEKRKIKYLGIDRSNAYKAAAIRHIPHIKVCYDAYHLVSNMNEVLDKIRRFTLKHPSYSLEQFMKGKRYVLLRGRENISQDARATLKELSILNRDLYIGYLLKEQFRQVFQTREVNAATLRLILWIKMCMKSKVKILRNFAKKISEQFNEVINGIRYRINSARIESANAAIKRIQAKSCGLFDVGYLFLKLRQVYFLRLQRKFKTSRSFYQQI